MRRSVTGRNECMLVDDGWDDFGYKTLFSLIYFDGTAGRHELGSLRIMRRGMEYGRIELKDRLLRLGKQYASLGTDQKFYENIFALGQEKAEELLESLRDAAWHQEIFEEFNDDPAFRASLMRGLGRSDVRRFSEIAHGRATPTPYRFEYTFPGTDGPVLSFEVNPHTLPPMNIHTVIGRNGVGKTRLLRSVVSLLCNGQKRGSDLGRLSFHDPRDEHDGDGRFANLVTVAFSAFDEIELPATRGTNTGIRVSYIGLRRPAKLPSSPKVGASTGTTAVTRAKTQLKSIPELTKEFLDSLQICLRSSRKQLWLSTITTLESDSIFGSMQLRRLADADDQNLTSDAKRIFRLASSGHKIVLLCLTRLIETVEERTLVLIDEPEAHLHPPLQASFIRALSSLLAVRNGVGLLATHSPVMLQEVPRSCVWLLFRDGLRVSAERPAIETFAENLGVLTREVFRLEVTQSGYHTLLKARASSSKSVEDLLAAFDDQVGAEGRAIARTLWRRKDKIEELP